MVTYHLQTVNHNAESGPLSLTAPRRTDIVGKPAAGARPYQFSSPISKISIPASQFKRARVTVNILEDHFEWDQAGLLFLRPHPELPNPDADHEGDAQTTPAFVKLGIESFRGELLLAAAAVKGDGPDWSIWPLPAKSRVDGKATFEFVKYGTLLAMLSIQEVDGVSKPTLLRTVPWCFEDIQESDPDLWIGVYASHPDLKNETQTDLTAKFSAFEIEDINGVTVLG